MEDLIDITCAKCGCSYQKPSVFKEYLEKSNHNVFYTWSLTYCDLCRREREAYSLTQLEYISNMLTKNKSE
jgi:hypothetical protein